MISPALHTEVLETTSPVAVSNLSTQTAIEISHYKEPEPLGDTPASKSTTEKMYEPRNVFYIITSFRKSPPNPVYNHFPLFILIRAS